VDGGLSEYALALYFSLGTLPKSSSQLWREMLIILYLQQQQRSICRPNQGSHTLLTDKAMPWLRRLVAGLSLRKAGFAPRSLQLDLCWTKWQWSRFISELLGCPCRYYSTVAPQAHMSSGRRTISPLVAAVQKHSLTL
jgi:hypothetical protein